MAMSSRYVPHNPSQTLVQVCVERLVWKRLPWKSAKVMAMPTGLGDLSFELRIPEIGYVLTVWAPRPLGVSFTELLEEAIELARKQNPWAGMEWDR